MQIGRDCDLVLLTAEARTKQSSKKGSAAAFAWNSDVRVRVEKGERLSGKEEGPGEEGLGRRETARVVPHEGAIPAAIGIGNSKEGPGWRIQAGGNETRDRRRHPYHLVLDGPGDEKGGDSPEQADARCSGQR